MEQAVLVLIGLAAGTLGSMLGLGGGFLIVPALFLLKGLDGHVATGTSIAVIVAAMPVALWRRGFVYRDVDWTLAAFLAVGAIAGALLGPWLSAQVSGQALRRMFAGVLLGLAALLFFGK